jgi:hypothetical protein
VSGDADRCKEKDMSMQTTVSTVDRHDSLEPSVNNFWAPNCRRLSEICPLQSSKVSQRHLPHFS